MKRLLELIASVKRGFSSKDISFLQRQSNRAADTAPYRDLKILHNIPFNEETLLKLEPLYLGGADLTVTSPSFMEVDKTLVESFISAGGRWLPLENVHEGGYDIHLDCAAELLHRSPPSIGTVELTGSGTNNYAAANLNYPVISVDQSKVKYLEAMLGTGEAFVRAFKILTKEDISAKKFLVFGYGKVGRGIAHQLRKQHADVVIVDKIDSNLQQARDAGLQAQASKDTETIHALAISAFAIVTATGVKNVISDNYDSAFFTAKYLANMGGEDEFGINFERSLIMCQKRPINFFVDKPTLFRYLDPVFYAHNMGIDLLLFSKLAPGLHPFPSFIADELVSTWTDLFEEALPV